MVVKITKGTKPSFETTDKSKFSSRHSASSAFGYSRHTIFYHRVIKGGFRKFRESGPEDLTAICLCILFICCLSVSNQCPKLIIGVTMKF